MADAKIRVSLDTIEALKSLDALYRRMGQPPTVRVPGMTLPPVSPVAPSPAMPAAPGGGGAVGGGIGAAGGISFGWLTGMISAAIGTLAVGRGTVRDAYATIGGLSQGISEGLRERLIGTASAAPRAGLRAQDQVIEQMALARGMGAASAEDARSLYQTLMQVEGPKARGESLLRGDLGEAISMDTIKALFAGEAGLLGDILGWLKERFGG